MGLRREASAPAPHAPARTHRPRQPHAKPHSGPSVCPYVSPRLSPFRPCHGVPLRRVHVRSCGHLRGCPSQVPRRSLACAMAVGPARLPVWGSAGRWSCSCADVRAEPRLATTAQRHVPRCRLRLPRPPRPRRGSPGRCHQPSALTGAGGASTDALSPRPAWTVPDSKHLCMRAPWVRRLGRDPRGHSGAIRQ